MRICVCECAHMRAHLLANLCSGDQHWGGGLSTPCYFLLTRVLTRVRLCVTLPGSSVYGILQARILEWVAIPSSNSFTEAGAIGMVFRSYNIDVQQDRQ